MNQKRPPSPSAASEKDTCGEAHVTVNASATEEQVIYISAQPPSFCRFSLGFSDILNHPPQQISIHLYNRARKGSWPMTMFPLMKRRPRVSVSNPPGRVSGDGTTPDLQPTILGLCLFVGMGECRNLPNP